MPKTPRAARRIWAVWCWGWRPTRLGTSSSPFPSTTLSCAVTGPRACRREWLEPASRASAETTYPLPTPKSVQWQSPWTPQATTSTFRTSPDIAFERARMASSRPSQVLAKGWGERRTRTFRPSARKSDHLTVSRWIRLGIFPAAGQNGVRRISNGLIRTVTSAIRANAVAADASGHLYVLTTGVRILRRRLTPVLRSRFIGVRSRRRYPGFAQAKGLRYGI